MGIRELLDAAAQRYSIPVGLAESVAYQESGMAQYWDSGEVIVSSAGAIGVMQLMPGTAAGLGVDPYNEAQNIDGGMRYLKTQYDRFGSWDLALAAYNAGPGAVEEYGGIPPYQETRNYVSSIMSAWGGSAAGGQAGGSVVTAAAGGFSFNPLYILVLIAVVLVLRK